MPKLFGGNRLRNLQHIETIEFHHKVPRLGKPPGPAGVAAGDNLFALFLLYVNVKRLSIGYGPCPRAIAIRV
jgi:hypothetical protein